MVWGVKEGMGVALCSCEISYHVMVEQRASKPCANAIAPPRPKQWRTA